MKFKDIKLKSKLLVGFGFVIALTVLLSVLSVIALDTTAENYKNKLDYSQQRVRFIMGIRYEVASIQRLAYAIRADSGNTTQMNAHTATADNIVRNINDYLDRYTDSALKDKAITPAQEAALISKADDFRGIITRYKRDLIDVNIQHGMNDSIHQITANTTAQAPLIASTQDVVDEMYVFEEELADSLYADTNRQAAMFEVVFIIVAFIVAVISLILAFGIAGHITKPMLRYDGWMKSASKGDVVWKPSEFAVLDVYKNREDEIGTMMKSYSDLMDYMGKISTALSRVAEGDLTIKVTPNSENDLLNRSLEKMIEDLNKMFSEINSGSKQVHSGSTQISGGAQSLAQGSTEQAATVEQLSASITDIAEKIAENAGMARNAATLSNTIKDNAERGSRQMDEMMSAVNEINASSQNISKVIKVIDDIAFQTNILALNAAVEAARAGQHGKGFAVVAEEVRNLAAKSAEAAKETGGLIANSTQKAELGARIAGETAASLADIVSGINESTKFINDIALSSEEQSGGIAQINSGITQVADVIQQNSATAEQSAAVAEELSGQSDMLEGLISQFKLSN